MSEDVMDRWRSPLAHMCGFCGHVLTDAGALIFSPPEYSRTYKFHVCVSCYDSIILPLLKGDAKVVPLAKER